jgi:hypothetical protein
MKSVKSDSAANQIGTVEFGISAKQYSYIRILKRDLILYYKCGKTTEL